MWVGLKRGSVVDKLRILHSNMRLLLQRKLRRIFSNASR